MSNSSWNVASSGDWNTPADWLGGVPDSATANAIIALPGTYTVDIGGGESVTAASVTLNNATATLRIDGALNLGGVLDLKAGRRPPCACFAWTAHHVVIW
jgi:hypothetical protein